MYQWLCITALALICMTLCWIGFSQEKEIKKLKIDVMACSVAIGLFEKRLGFRDGAVVEAITGNLDEELEKSAVMTEMRQAKRRSLPREDAGPPATVRRMKFYRGK